MEGYWLQVSEIVLVNLVLSGDNALLIAMATSKLPYEQRRQAMIFGISAGMIIRMILTGIAAELMLLPFVRAIGAMLLIVIAVSLIHSKPAESIEVRSGTLISAVAAILLADLTMSLDNVAALAGMAEGNLPLLLTGLLISLLFMLVASAGISMVLERFPYLVFVGAGILAWTGGRILAGDSGVSRIAGKQVWVMLLIIVVVMYVFSHLKSRPAEGHKSN